MLKVDAQGYNIAQYMATFHPYYLNKFFDLSIELEDKPF